MDEVTARDLRYRIGEVLDRVSRGESVIVTRRGVPVGELRQPPVPPLSTTSLLARWRNVPAVDAAAFRSDVEAAPEPSLCRSRNCP